MTQEQAARIAALEKQVWQGLHDASTGMGLNEIDGWEVAVYALIIGAFALFSAVDKE